MKISPVSGDLVVKLALAAAIVGAAVWAARRAAAAVPDFSDVADAARAGNFTAAAVSQYIRPGSANFV